MTLNDGSIATYIETITEPSHIPREIDGISHMPNWQFA